MTERLGNTWPEAERRHHQIEREKRKNDSERRPKVALKGIVERALGALRQSSQETENDAVIISAPTIAPTAIKA